MRRLTFRDDNTFTIVQFTDVHWKDGDDKDLRSRVLMEEILAAEQPDPVQSFRQAVDSVNKQRIPWVIVYGNHDTERLVTRQHMTDHQSRRLRFSTVHFLNTNTPGNMRFVTGVPRVQRIRTRRVSAGCPNDSFTSRGAEIRNVAST